MLLCGFLADVCGFHIVSSIHSFTLVIYNISTNDMNVLGPKLLRAASSKSDIFTHPRAAPRILRWRVNTLEGRGSIQ